MNIGYEYFFKKDLKEQLDIKSKKNIGKYHYSPNAYINIAHEKKNTLNFDYLIFEFFVDEEMILSTEQIIQDKRFLYHEIQKKWSSFFIVFMLKERNYLKMKNGLTMHMLCIMNLCTKKTKRLSLL